MKENAPKIEKFQAPKAPLESLDTLEKRVHELSQDSKNVLFLTNHAKQRKKERKVISRQIIDVLRFGKAISGPDLDSFGDWRIKLKRFSAGRLVQVVVVVGKSNLIVVTVI